MAENETKPERKQIEMSIWFVILLIVVIVFMCVFMSMNKKLGDANDKITELEAQYATLSGKYSAQVENVRVLVDQVYSLSPDQLREKLSTLSGSEGAETETTSGENVSGETISGEVIE